MGCDPKFALRHVKLNMQRIKFVLQNYDIISETLKFNIT